MEKGSEDIPLYNSRVIDSYIKIIRRHYSHINLGDILEYASMNIYEIADQGHWFTQKQVDLFYERLVQVTGNENIAREAGRYAASPEAIGVMRQYVLGMLGPAKVFEILDKTAANFSRSSIYQAKKISGNKFEITVTPFPGVNEKPFQCQNRMGFFESVVMMFNHTIPDLKHKECIFEGGLSCKYIISWKNSFSSLWKRVRNLTSIFLFMGLPILLFFGSKPLVSAILPASATILFIMFLTSEWLEKEQLKKSLEHVKDSTEKLLEHINSNYNNALMTNEIGQAISKQTSPDDILLNVTTIIENRLDFDRGMILLIDEKKKKLIFKSSFGYFDEYLETLKNTEFNLDNPESKGVFIKAVREGKPYLVNNINEIEKDLSKKSLSFANKLGAKSFICCPITFENKSLGVLAVDNVKSKRPLVHSDISLITGIASVIGISIRNAELLQTKMEQFKSLLQVLAASTDARDFLTAGHSEKVTEYSLGICKELGLPEEYCEIIRVAALLHDYGKIAIPDSVLKKEGRLTEEEYEIIKTHSTKTREILERINFDGLYKQVPEITGAHHEKVDGTGYPNGLKGKDIPMGAKIIAVADFFEAITSKRHYREPMTQKEAFVLLRQGIGTHFEKKFVEAFIRYYSKTYPDRFDDGQDSGGNPQKRPDRLPVRTPLSIRSEGKTFFGTSTDLNIFGMYVASDEQLQPAEKIELSFQLPESGSGLITVVGKVVWINNREERTKPFYPPGFGVQFMGVREAAIFAIQDFLAVKPSLERSKDHDQLSLDIPFNIH